MSELTGTIAVICPTEQISEKFSKRSLIVDIGGDTPINLEYHFDDCALLDGFVVGEQVKVAYDLDGRKWTNPQGVDKYFVTLKIASIDKLTVLKTPQQQQPAPQQEKPFEAPPMDHPPQPGSGSEVPF